jgi:uncharacterized protein DUF6869
LIDGYWKHYRLSTGSRQERSDADKWAWAWDDVEGAVMEPSANTFEMLMALVESAADDDALAYIGAGPLEDLINSHGVQFAGQIEESARRVPKFRTALAHVHLSSNVSASVRERLARIMPPR